MLRRKEEGEEGVVGVRDDTGKYLLLCSAVQCSAVRCGGRAENFMGVWHKERNSARGRSEKRNVMRQAKSSKTDS